MLNLLSVDSRIWLRDAVISAVAGAVVVFFKVANDALKNKQIS